MNKEDDALNDVVKCYRELMDAKLRVIHAERQFDNASRIYDNRRSENLDE